MAEPSEHAAYIRSGHPDARLDHLDGVVLVYQNSLLRRAQATYRLQPLPRWCSADLFEPRRSEARVAVCGGLGPGGAPGTALVVEQLIALGARAIATVGTAATLRTTLSPGDLVIADRALRDEGTSHHYLPPGRYTHSDATLTAHLTEALTVGTDRRTVTGGTWTTDALYRETEAEVAHYAACGLLTADMEAAAVFAVACHRAVPATAGFAVADSLADRRPRTGDHMINSGLDHLLAAALLALTRNGAGSRGHYDGPSSA
ncbi:nucleoside phosphorylase [Streptomyces sp. NPDC059134]|uniref:nucleoside phosphorylase n=1 Tax=Streptomyces sp. NPDC059134 TaxID=3346738 RepID=UPI0036BC3FD3